MLAALGRFSYRWRGAIAAAFVLLFAGTYILQLSTQIAYTLTDTDPVAEVFPPDNPIVVLYNNADEDAVAALADRLEADTNVKSAMAYSTTLGRQYTAAQMANVVGALDASIPVSADMLGMIYYDAHSGGRAVTIPAGRFLRFVTDHVANNAAFAPYLDAGMTAIFRHCKSSPTPPRSRSSGRRSHWRTFSAWTRRTPNSCCSTTTRSTAMRAPAV